jgi:hypothetical protein
VIVGLLDLVGAIVYFPIFLMGVATRRTVPNAIIWLLLIWYFGWLDPVATRLATWNWSQVQASQVAAILGLAVIGLAAIIKSDVRGRVEFSKTASIECRKRLLQLRPHLLQLIEAEQRVRRLVARELVTFPDESVLEGLTGYHGLRWDKGRISDSNSEKCLSHQRHPNLVPEPGFGNWRRHSSVASHQADDSTDRDLATKEHYDAVKSALLELRDLGYYPKLVEVLPPIGRSALSEFEWSDNWYWGLEGIASVKSSPKGHVARGDVSRYNPLLQWDWSTANTTKQVNSARRSTEAAIRRVIREARDDLWDGYKQSARVAALLNSIGRSQRERLIDRLKQ